jgi:16S rRNA (cytosine1402-N4)-methyltransferase
VTVHPDFAHTSVLAAEVVRLLAGCRRVVDGTAGAGGHARLLADAGAEVLAFDQDPAAVAAAEAALAGRGRVRRGEFAAAARDPEVAAFRPDGVFLDLGVSSPQLDDAGRGFTFREGAPLDMRMSGEGPSAADWLNDEPEAGLAGAFADFGDEPRARSLARAVARRRAHRPFATSDDFVNAVREVLGPRSGPPDFARLFQAVRIAVNDELARLAAALEGYRTALVPGGVLAVISYHSGEDRIVKHAFREWARACICPTEQPLCTCRGRPLGVLLTRRPIGAGAAEVAANPRARSGRLRAFRTAA